MTSNDLAAVIGVTLGADWLLMFALFCLIFTVRPLAAIRRLPPLDQTTRLRFTFRAAPARDGIANGCFGSEEAISTTLWPMYLAVVLGTYSEIGAVTALSVLGTIIAVWLAGHYGDRGRNRSVLTQGIAGMSIVNVFRLTTTALGPITLLGIAYRVTQGYALNGLNSTYYSHAKDQGLQYIVSIELASDVGYLATWAVLFATIALSESNATLFMSGFAIAAVVVWGTLLFTPYRQREFSSS